MRVRTEFFKPTRAGAALPSLFCFLLLLLLPSARAQEGPPKEEGDFREPELVELIKLDRTLRLDIRYATKNNFTGRAVYTEARAFLQRPAAEALVRVNRALRKEGFGVVVFDGYRPWRVTKLFWDLTPADKKQFVADPARGSRHNRGCAVDLTLRDLRTGRQVSMPGEYDEMSERSHVNYSARTSTTLAARPSSGGCETCCAPRWRPKASPSTSPNGGTSTTRTGGGIRSSTSAFYNSEISRARNSARPAPSGISRFPGFDNFLDNCPPNPPTRTPPARRAHALLSPFLKDKALASA